MFQVPLGIVIVDPITDTVMARASNLRHQHPVHHATMVAVDLIAQGQGGGAMKGSGELWLSSTLPDYEINSLRPGDAYMRH